MDVFGLLYSNVIIRWRLGKPPDDNVIITKMTIFSTSQINVQKSIYFIHFIINCQLLHYVYIRYDDPFIFVKINMSLLCERYFSDSP